MLQLKDIRKSYTTFDFTQTALDGVSIAFRDNEFAAILGPSGSGKTTMLNIIGGLDQYDSGDLEIDNISTKRFKARDWDTYRNNRIGFVFQSYNLIPHQTVLSNVELALTLSGVSKKERHARARKALEEVGLEEHMRKKPSQLSGGQMQRVAIARALINDPEILLADEPTGALDTKTSTQVMDLLTRIAKDRLVIMVTHNAELAQSYANRIVHLKDGQIVSDSNPFDPAMEEWRKGREARKASMSFWTALTLSFSNLMTKKGRTFVTSLAGSIGIIGIAAILALANGINAYIKNVEEETLSIYPLTIQRSGIDLGSMLEGPNNDGGRGDRNSNSNGSSGSVRERRVVRTMFSFRNHNDLASLKAYFIEDRQEIDQFVNSIHYMYDITPQIFLADTSDGAEQVNPDAILSASGIGGGGMASMMGIGGFGMNAFSEMPGELALFEHQYDVLAGHWPTQFNEMMLVLSPGGRVTDFELYAMGLRERTELRTMIEAFMNDTDTDVELESNGNAGSSFSYETLMSAEFKLINPADRFQYDDTFDIWIDRSGDESFIESLVDNGQTLRIVGIARPDPSLNATSLVPGINYTPELVSYLMEQATKIEIVQEQLFHPSVNVLTGKTFEEEKEEAGPSFDFSKIISVDENAFRDALSMDFSDFDFDLENLNLNLDPSAFDLSDFNFDSSSMDFSNMDLDFSNMDLDFSNMNLDFSNMDLDFSNLGDFNIDMGTIQLPEFDMGPLINDIASQVQIPTGAIVSILVEVIQDFLLNEIVNNGISDPNQIMTELANYLSSPEAQALIAQRLSQVIDTTLIQEQITQALQNFIQTAVQAYMEQMVAQIQAQIQAQLQQAMQSAMAQVQAQIQAQLQQAMQSVMAQVQAQIQAQLQQAMQGVMTQVQSQIEQSMQGVMTQIQAQMQTAMEGVATQIQEGMQDAMGQLTTQMQNIDGGALAGAFQLNLGEEEILELMTSIMNPVESTFERNLSTLGYANPNEPSQINIYPRDFDSKQEVLNILDHYNERMEAEGMPERVVRYTDLIGVMMASVTDIIGMVSTALIAFVAISLVVSSIMIGVITYISVLERKKEIGILRAIGASKQNIRRVFNAETLIVGFVAGVLGILVTLLLTVIANIIVYNRFDIEHIARLPWEAALALIGVSMLLTFIAGLIPSSAAARKDPVEALRSE